MWTPFGTSSERINISKMSILSYSENHPKFRTEELINKYYGIYKTLGRISKIEQDLIREQINRNIQILLEKNIFKQENGFIIRNCNLRNCSIF